MDASTAAQKAIAKTDPTMDEPASLVPAADQQTEMALSPACAEFLPFQDHDEWLKLLPEDRDRIEELIEAFAIVNRVGHGMVRALKSLAQANAGRKGWSEANLRTLYYAWLQGGRSWTALKRWYRHDTTLPEAFVDFLRTLVLKEFRSRTQALAKLRAMWAAGEPVPGYGTWREWFARTWPQADVPAGFCGDYPPGWSRSNLYQHMPPPAQHALATRGRAAAMKFMPTVIRDTSSLRPLELVTIDDFELDVMCRHGNRLVRVRGLLAIDVATRRRLAVGLKPRLETDSGTQMAINDEDMRTVLRSLFQRWGVPRGYSMTLLVENATARITADYEAALNLHFRGQVQVSRTAMINHRTLANGFIERGGTPGQKGWIEADFSLLHNLLGSLPGQKGSRYDDAPGDHDAKLKAARTLLEVLSPEQVGQVRLPFPSFEALHTAMEAALDLMDHRTEHKLLGFDRVLEWRLETGAPWQAYAELLHLSSEQRLQAEVRERMESPVERWEKLARGLEFMPVPEAVLALLTFDVKKTVMRNYRVTFKHSDRCYTFAESASSVLRERDGTPVLAYFDVRSMARIHCFDLEGRYLGAIRQLGAANIKDADAIGAAAAECAKIFQAHVQGPVRELLAADDAQLAEDRAHNQRLLEQWGLAPVAKSSPAIRTAIEPRVRVENQAGNRPRVNSLSRTLAQDQFAEPAGGRFVTAAAQAQAIATHTEALQARAVRDEAALQQDMGKGLADLIPEPCTAPAMPPPDDPSPDAEEDVDLSDLI
jgi:hypothetical protein